MEHWTLRLLRRRQKLLALPFLSLSISSNSSNHNFGDFFRLYYLLVPLHHLRPDSRDSRPRIYMWVCSIYKLEREVPLIYYLSSACGASGALFALVSAITGCSCIYSCFYRKRLRSQYALPESPCADFFVHCFCQWCALCQEHRELRKRGFDMDIGQYFVAFSLVRERENYLSLATSLCALKFSFLLLFRVARKCGEAD